MRANGFSRSGAFYSFTGWNTKADGTGTPYAAGASYSSAANLTLYAQWKVEGYTITWSDALSSIGGYLEDGYNSGNKSIEYTNIYGETQHTSPYRGGFITVKAGTKVKLHMVAGHRTANMSATEWLIDGNATGYKAGNQNENLTSEWTPTNNYTLYKDTDWDISKHDGNIYTVVWRVGAYHK